MQKYLKIHFFSRSPSRISERNSCRLFFWEKPFRKSTHFIPPISASKTRVSIFDALLIPIILLENTGRIKEFRAKKKEQTLPLLQKWQTPKIPFARWQVLTWGENPIEGENHLSYQLLKFLPLCSSQTFTVDTSLKFFSNQVYEQKKKNSKCYPVSISAIFQRWK